MSHLDDDGGFGPGPVGHSPMPTMIGDYQVVNRLGGGSMAELFLAHKMSRYGFVRQAVVKRVKRSRPDYQQLQEMLLDEARATACFDHPNLVSLFDVGETDAGVYLALEFVEGSDLRRVNAKLRMRKEALPFELATFITVEVLRGLHHAHTARDQEGRLLEIVHRDVNPSNVLISRSGHVKLADFGVVRMRERVQQKTEPGLVKGKYAYLAPEYIAGESCSVQTDVYAAGIMLFELLSGRECFSGKTAYEVMWKIVNKGVPMYRLEREGVPEDLQRIVQRATAMAPERRYQTAQDMANALEAWLMRSGRHATPWVLSVFFQRHELLPSPDESSRIAPLAHLTDAIDRRSMHDARPASASQSPHPGAPRVVDNSETPLPEELVGDYGDEAPPRTETGPGQVANGGFGAGPRPASAPQAPAWNPSYNAAETHPPYGGSHREAPTSNPHLDDEATQRWYPPAEASSGPAPAAPASGPSAPVQAAPFNEAPGAPLAPPSSDPQGAAFEAPPEPADTSGAVVAPPTSGPRFGVLDEGPDSPPRFPPGFPPGGQAPQQGGWSPARSEARTVPAMERPKNLPPVGYADPRAVAPESSEHTPVVAQPEKSGRAALDPRAPPRSGKLEETSAVDLLECLNEGAYTGVVEFRCGLIWKRVKVFEGMPMGVTSNMGMELIGEHLVKSRVISREQLHAALQRSERDGRPLTATLIEDGALDRARLEEELGRNLGARLNEVLEWRWGTFDLKAEAVQAAEFTPRLDLPGLFARARAGQGADSGASVEDDSGEFDTQRKLEKAIDMARSIASSSGKGQIERPWRPKEP
ncbi:MAG: protein kinase [Myxococcota bacterium]